MPKPNVGDLGWGETLNAFLDTKAELATWQSWTPEWTGSITVGNGTSSGQYVQHDKTVIGRATLVLGSTSAVTGPINLVPPTTPDSNFGPGQVQFTDSGSNYYFGDVRYANSSFALYARSANGGAVSPSLNVPFTWVAGDFIEVRFIYRTV